MVVHTFFLEQNTTYEMRISYWSSDVCSSDRPNVAAVNAYRKAGFVDTGELVYGAVPSQHPELYESFNVSEAYGELVVPLLSDLPFARRLEVEGAYRYSDYSTVGATHAWKAGAMWSPIDGVSFRGVRARSVRTPTLG